MSCAQLRFSGSLLPQLKKKSWRFWKQGASKDPLRQTPSASSHFSTFLSLLWANRMLMGVIYVTFLACSLKCLIPLSFDLYSWKGRTLRSGATWRKKPRSLRRAAQKSPWLSQEWELTCIVRSQREHRAYSLQLLTATLSWLMCSFSKILCI